MIKKLKNMNLTVKTRGKKVLLKLDKDECWVKDVKRTLIRKLDEDNYFPPDSSYAPLYRRALVVQKGKYDEYLKLEEGRTLADYNIRNRATLYLLDRFNWPEYYNGSWGTSDNCIKTIQAIESSCS